MIGNKVCFFQTLPSTNTFMKDHLDEFRDGDMVVSRIQTEGRGRRDNTWVSKAGNLHTSFYLNNAKTKRDPFSIVMRTSLAVVDTLKTFDVLAKIKYPNDVVMNKRKIAGILIEQLGDDIVVGVGINVTFRDVDEYEFHPSSIFLERNESVDYRDVLSSFIHAFNALEDIPSSDILKRYKMQSVVLGETIKYNDKTVIVTDISEDGALVVDDSSIGPIQPNEITLTAWYDE